jgi:hypothetical protein
MSGSGVLVSVFEHKPFPGVEYMLAPIVVKAATAVPVVRFKEP